MIRVLDGGPAAAAVRGSAAWVWGVPGFGADARDVARARDGSSRSSAGTDHWPRLLPAHHLTVVRGIPVTTLARTIFDLAATPKLHGRLPRIIDTIHGRSPSILLALHTMLDELAQRGRGGITFMRATLAERPVGTIPRTGVERRFEHVLAAAGLHVPRLQVDLGGHAWIGRVDYYDDDIGVIYEIDSALHHLSLTDQRNDALRDEAARAAGFREVVRIREEDVWYDPPAVVRAVRDARRVRRHDAA
jgi:very-short-patch-repair endonuclease